MQKEASGLWKMEEAAGRSEYGDLQGRWLSSTSALVTRRTQTANPLSVRKQKMRDELLHSMDAADNRRVLVSIRRL